MLLQREGPHSPKAKVPRTYKSQYGPEWTPLPAKERE